MSDWMLEAEAMVEGFIAAVSSNRNSKREQRAYIIHSYITGWYNSTLLKRLSDSEVLKPTYRHSNVKLAFYNSGCNFYIYKAAAQIIAVLPVGMCPLKDELAQVMTFSCKKAQHHLHLKVWHWGTVFGGSQNCLQRESGMGNERKWEWRNMNS